MDDHKAMRQIKKGEIAGLEHLVQCYQARALRPAYLITRDVAAAEDVVQTAFLRVYRRVEQFDLERPFGPWFLRIVVNDALKVAAAGERQVSLESAEADSVFALAQPGPSLDELLADAETSATVWAALGALPATQRTTIVLRYYLDLSEAEIAVRMASPPGTVKSRLYAARQRLRQILPSWLTPAETVSTLAAKEHADDSP